MSADPEDKATYNAEEQVSQVLKMTGERMIVHGTEFIVPTERRFGDLGAMQRYIDAVQGLNWFRARWPNLPRVIVEMSNLKTLSKADLGANKILISKSRFHHDELVLLHELAHLCVGPDHGHDAVFRGIFCDLMTDCIGAEIGWLLSVRYQEAGLTVG